MKPRYAAPHQPAKLTRTFFRKRYRVTCVCGWRTPRYFSRYRAEIAQDAHQRTRTERTE